MKGTKAIVAKKGKIKVNYACGKTLEFSSVIFSNGVINPLKDIAALYLYVGSV